MEAGELLCPMKMDGGEQDYQGTCLKARCAWWLPLENCCTVKRIGEGADK